MNSSLRCDGVSRRNIIRVGGLTAFGLGIGGFHHCRRANADHQPVAKAKSCILVWLDGGPSHLESFDVKPDAAEEVRGPLGSIPTSISGVRIGECLPRLAGLLHKMTIVRSMTSPLGEHNFGTHYMMTGYRPSPALDYPAFGSTLSMHRPASGVLPPNVAVPQFTGNIQDHGFLPTETAAFEVGGKPDQADFRVKDLDFYRGLDLQRLDRRRQFVDAIDQFSRVADAGGLKPNEDLRRAYDLIASADAKAAFDIHREPDAVRKRYGRVGGNGVGQSCLLARRLVERGVPFVTVNSPGWDTHQDIVNLKQRFPNDQNAHLPALDRAVSALVEDLDQRGRLDDTLVIVMGEFGRTPKINTRGGRDHWPNCFSVLLAGGGITAGNVYGASDAQGELPADQPVTPADLAATVYTMLGIDPAGVLKTSDGRPVRITPDGSQAIRGIMA
ncbi:DUF1501 domain-containing protein [Crateriforma conspicua]|uniref:Sulfatase n=1 Tax=Crateriforma conspicua TaxID=2527996 RepID=A0A5C6FUV8_9PLAN|nr:DUF1501 domain-containing protein [Crateriforma conspicua]TWU66729.1 hypothetical protein V7x_23000 [Crateriforma conspicua]